MARRGVLELVLVAGKLGEAVQLGGGVQGPSVTHKHDIDAALVDIRKKTSSKQDSLRNIVVKSRLPTMPTSNK
ncbi:hypothetical protein [Nocardia sp. NPDC050413]|uniref:hypothetical protein n=1 Tax=Nocardia sp. NPDC050413 TaxID=3155784 RepID=UPI003403CAE6